MTSAFLVIRPAGEIGLLSNIHTFFFSFKEKDARTYNRCENILIAEESFTDACSNVWVMLLEDKIYVRCVHSNADAYAQIAHKH